MGSHVSVLGYFMQAGFIVKLVMIILVAASVASWTLIIQRAWYFKEKKQQYDAFSRRFWGATDLSKLYADIDSNIEDRHGLAAIFHAGFKEFIRIRKQGPIVIEPIQRVMQISYTKEAERLEHHLPLFASVGSLAPYVGLFGTV